MDYPTCLYGRNHAGDAYAVRNNRGITINGLCESHKRDEWDHNPPKWCHLRTWQELAEREDKQHDNRQSNPGVGGTRPQTVFRNDARETAESEGIYRLSASDRQELSFDDTGAGAESDEPVRERPFALGSGRQSVAYHPAGDHDNGADRCAQGAVSQSEGALEEKNPLSRPELVTGAVRPPRVAGDSFSAPLTWWQGAGELVLEEWQISILQSPVDPNQVETRPDGLLYVPWVHTWRKFLEAFAPSVPALVPIDKPQLHGDTVIVHYVMLVNGQFIGEAVGECKYQPKNARMSYASAIEGAVSDAITRIGKRLGVNTELWDPAAVRHYKGVKQHA